MVDYILKDGQPIPAADREEYIRFRQDFDNRCVAEGTVGAARISTVFTSIDHSYGMSSLPVLWETMILSDDPQLSDLDEYIEHYTSRADAEAGHARAVELVRQRIGC